MLKVIKLQSQNYAYSALFLAALLLLADVGPFDTFKSLLVCLIQIYAGAELLEKFFYRRPLSIFEKNRTFKAVQINHLDNLQILSSHDNNLKNNKFAHKISIEYFELIKNIIKPKYINKINYGN